MQSSNCPGRNTGLSVQLRKEKKRKEKKGECRRRNFSRLAVHLMQQGQQSMVKGIHPYIRRRRKKKGRK